MAIDSIPARLLERGKRLATKDAYFVKTGTQWVPTKYDVYADETRRAARALVSLGMEAGGTVAILGFNRPEWVIFDVAAMMAGGAPAGIYTTCAPVKVSYIIGHAEATVVLVENADQWEKVRETRHELPNLKWVVMMKDGATIDDDMVLSWEEFMAKADDTPDSVIDERLEGIKEDQIATFIYTSGTTGPPKAVMLSHKNLTWTADVAQQLVSMESGDCSVSYLPLSHIAEQMFSIHGPITAGSSIYFAESLEKIADNFKEVEPTILFAVPRIWEKFYAGVQTKLKGSTGLKAKIGGWARKVGTEANGVLNDGGQLGGLLQFKYNIANKLVFSKIKPALGLGRVRVCVSGAAPISSEIIEFFAGFDIVIREVYGQSEGSGPTTFNIPGKTRYGTVGPKIPGVEVKILEDGEIVARGPNIFLGYYKDEAATNETLIDGWLHSGDLGKFDDDGYLSITGRKKDIIITAGGKNIAPQNVESALKDHPLISQAVMIGDRRKFCSALLALDPDAVAAHAAEHKIAASAVYTDESVLADLQKWVDKVNAKGARVEHVRKFTVLKNDFTPLGDDPELTPTLKVKRNVVARKYETDIEAMYAD
ncbi:MAG: long-chain acyl-CoA synthetase [Myxococcota bacterium]|jgi:long-chain acyl-CoA synthetase